MARHLEKTCEICLKTMTNNNLIRHIENSQFSTKNAIEFYTNSTGGTFNVLQLLDYSYINTNYESIPPHDKGVKKIDNIKMETIENVVNTETTQEEMDTHDTYEAENHMSLTSINFDMLKIK